MVDRDGLVCVGCAMLAANGDDIGDGGDGIAPLALCDGFHVNVDPRASFSWSPCDGCGSRLGGDRFVAYFSPV